MSTLESDRLLLRPFREDDLSALLAIQSRPDVARWLYWEPRTEVEVREALDRKIRAAELAEASPSVEFAVQLRETGEMIGTANLAVTSAEHRQGEIGYLLHPDHQGRGYATEAARLLLGLAFDQHDLHRVVGRLETRNTASARVLERLGMRREADFVENEWVKDEWQSETVYAMLDREWRALTDGS